MDTPSWLSTFIGVPTLTCMCVQWYAETHRCERGVCPGVYRGLQRYAEVHRGVKGVCVHRGLQRYAWGVIRIEMTEITIVAFIFPGCAREAV